MGGITIVISPLVALIDEQAEKIEEQGFNVLSIHGGMRSTIYIALQIPIHRIGGNAND